jgi:hypothetical protein
VLDRVGSEIAPTGSGWAHSQAGADCQIAQKTPKNELIDKLYDGWITMLAGAHGLVRINTRLRADEISVSST